MATTAARGPREPSEEIFFSSADDAKKYLGVPPYDYISFGGGRYTLRQFRAEEYKHGERLYDLRGDGEFALRPLFIYDDSTGREEQVTHYHIKNNFWKSADFGITYKPAGGGEKSKKVIRFSVKIHVDGGGTGRRNVSSATALAAAASKPRAGTPMISGSLSYDDLALHLSLIHI